MARADLICDLIKYGLDNDSVNFRKVAEAICAEEQARQHWVLASRIEKMLQVSNGMQFKELHNVILKNSNDKDNLVLEKNPQRNFDSLILPKCVADSCKELVEEHMRSDILRSYGLEPRNKVLLIGPPGNGKTTLAEAIAQSLMLPFMIVRYESLVGSYLGETAARLSKLFEYAKERQCILFFDEFETLAKERGDAHETGEIKRVVSSLLLQIDALPSHVIVIAATNHDRLLDHAAWRRFQIRLLLPGPSKSDLEIWFKRFEERTPFSFGYSATYLARELSGKSFAEAEQFALSVYRRYILQLPASNEKQITQNQLKLLWSQANRVVVVD